MGGTLKYTEYTIAESKEVHQQYLHKYFSWGSQLLNLMSCFGSKYDLNGAILPFYMDWKCIIFNIINTNRTIFVYKTL